MLTHPRKRLALELGEAIRDGLGRPDPYHGGAPEGSVFRTSFDWHSSVHAHWALLSIARSAGDAGLARVVLDRVTGSAIERERRYLKENPRFEAPYGRAWLTLLLDELRRHGAAFDDFASENRESVADHLERAPFPEREGELSGLHDSWLFADLLFSLGDLDDGMKARQAGWRRKRLTPELRDRISARAPRSWEFMDLPAVLYLSDSLTGVPPRPYGRAPFSRASLPELPPMTRELAHYPGEVAVRSWPSAHDTSMGREGAEAEYSSRLESLAARPDYWGESFEWTSHWVPQFIWMGIWLEAGRP